MDGTTPTRITPARLAEILAAHARYQSSGGRDGAFADLCGYLIEGYDFEHINLAGVECQSSAFVGCKFDGADLSYVRWNYSTVRQCSATGAVMKKSSAFQAV